MNRVKEFNSDVQKLCQQVRLAVPSDESSPLPVTFQPRPEDVICARGKSAWNHPGNERFRILLEMNFEKYIKATTKLQKSILVSDIIASVYQGEGIFVKRSKCGNWFQVGDPIAREKVGQCLRDMMQRRQQNTTHKVRSRRTEPSEPQNLKSTPSSDAVLLKSLNNTENIDCPLSETYQPLPLDFAACDQLAAEWADTLAPLFLLT